MPNSEALTRLSTADESPSVAELAGSEWVLQVRFIRHGTSSTGDLVGDRSPAGGSSTSLAGDPATDCDRSRTGERTRSVQAATITSLLLELLEASRTGDATCLS